MGVELKMPALSPTMEEGTLAKWLVKEGDSVSSGDILAEIETDKATMEFEAVDEGTISKILVPEGTDGVKVGTVIAMMGGDEGEQGEAPAAESAADEPAKEQKAAESGTPEPKQAETGARQLFEAAQHKPEARDPDIPAGTEMKPTSVREALRDAMAEEMRRDERVFVMGEEVAQYQGAYKVTQGLLEEFGPQARRRHADYRIWLRRAGDGRGDGRAEADRRVHDLQLRDAGDRPDHQFGGQDQLYVGRPDALPDRVPRAQRRRKPRRRAAQPELRTLVRQRARPGRDRAL